MADPVVDIPPMEVPQENGGGPAMPPPPPAAAMGNGGAPPPNPMQNNNNNNENDDNNEYNNDYNDDNNNENYQEPPQNYEEQQENEPEIEQEPEYVPEPEPEPEPEPKKPPPKPKQVELKEEKSPEKEIKKKSKPKQKSSKKESQNKGKGEPWNADENDTTKSCWQEISKKKGSTINWYACKQKTKKSTNLIVVGKGSDGINEIREYLQGRATVIRFVLLRVNSSDIGNEHSSNRAKFVFFKYYGSKAKRGGLLGKLGKILEKFPVRHLEIDADETLEKMNAESLGKQFLRVGGAHKPDQYDFGGGVIFKTK